jgi:hypothetical protein
LRNAFRSGVYLQAIIKNGEGNVLFAECYTPNSIFSGENNTGSYVVFGNEVEDDTVQIPINYKMKAVLDKADSVELNVTRSCLKVNN